MSHTARRLLESILSLPEAERAAIADALLSSLDEVQREHENEAFSRELQRRSQEMTTDAAAGIFWSELKERR